MDELSALMIYSEEELDPATLAEIQDELRAVEGVQGAGGQTRSLDPATLDIWVKLAASAISTATAAIPVLTGLIGVLRRRGLENTTIELRDGTRISVANATPEDIGRILKASRGGTD